MIHQLPVPRLRRALGRLLLLATATLSLTACETPVRVPGLSFAFPETAPGVVAAKRSTGTLLIAPSTDQRPSHFGRPVAQTDWRATKADTLADGALPKLVDERIAQAVDQAGLFAAVAATDAQPAWVLESEIQVFCSQTRGFVIRRVAGIVAVKFKLKKGGSIVWEQTIERVVTDADAEYTGASVTTVEQAMRRSMADSLRLVLRDALQQMDKVVQAS